MNTSITHTHVREYNSFKDIATCNGRRARDDECTYLCSMHIYVTPWRPVLSLGKSLFVTE